MSRKQEQKLVSPEVTAASLEAEALEKAGVHHAHWEGLLLRILDEPDGEARLLASARRVYPEACDPSSAATRNAAIIAAIAEEQGAPAPKLAEIIKRQSGA